MRKVSLFRDWESDSTEGPEPVGNGAPAPAQIKNPTAVRLVAGSRYMTISSTRLVPNLTITHRASLLVLQVTCRTGHLWDTSPPPTEQYFNRAAWEYLAEDLPRYPISTKLNMPLTCRNFAASPGTLVSGHTVKTSYPSTKELYNGCSNRALW